MTKYAAALIQIVIALAGTLTVLHNPITVAAALGVVPLIVNVLLVHLVPLFGTQMRSGWKTGGAVAVAVAAAAVPFALTGHITGSQAIVVLLAGMQALGAHIGVQIRNTTPTPAVTTPSTVTVGGPVLEPPTTTTINQAITATGGEFIGEPAR